MSPTLPSPHPPNVPRSVCLVGAGPRTLGVLQRLGVQAASGTRLTVHVVDPHDAGAGRIWRQSQDPLLWMNSRAADITVLPDPGPSLFRWIALNRRDLVHEAALHGDDLLREEVLAVVEGSFVSRRLVNRYLRWAWNHVVAGLPANVVVRHHRTRVVDVLDGSAHSSDADPGHQEVHLESASEPLLVDAVLLQQGHLETAPDPRERRIQRLAEANRLTYVRPGYTSDLDLDGLRAGEDVIVLGMGLAFVDLLVRLGEGRGGQFSERADGGLDYLPSGAEPVLHAGSRRGVPYRSKIAYAAPPAPPLPRYYTVESATARGPGDLDLRRDLWPLIVKELAGAHYHELFRAHGGRVTMDAGEFDTRFSAGAWGSAELDRLVTDAVPDPADRFDLGAFDRPLSEFWGTDADDVTQTVLEHLQADVARRSDPAHSPDAAVVAAVVSAYGVTARLNAAGMLSARSVALDLDGWWHGFFSYVASGPPPLRLRQMAALTRAGVLRFTGADTVVSFDPDRRLFRAVGSSGPAAVEARALVEARLPHADTGSSSDPLLQALHRRGAVSVHAARETGPDGGTTLSNGRLVVDGERLVGADGRVHPRRLAAGAWVAGGGSPGAFARPGATALLVDRHDETARRLLAACHAPHGVLTVTSELTPESSVEEPRP